MIDLLATAPADVCQLLQDWPIVLEMVPPPGSVIIVAGAYQGKLIDLLSRLQPQYGQIIGFEPQNWARERAVERLADRANIVVYPWGLGVRDEVLPMGEAGTDAASFVNTGPGSREQSEGQLLEADRHLTQLLGDSRIGLFVLNVEGYEFELLPLFRRTGWLERIDRLAVQWHLDLGEGTRYTGSGQPVMKGAFGAESGEPFLQPLNRQTMNNEINYLQADGFHKVYDRRPAWTYHDR